MANRRFQSSISRGEVLRWLIPFCTLVALSLVGVWEVFHGNRPHLLLIFLAVFLSGLAVLASEFLHSRTVLREARFARDTLHKAMLAGNSVAWDLDVRTGEDNWFGDLKTMFGIPSETFTTRLGDFYKRVHPDDRRRVSQAVAHAQANHVPYASEFRIIREDGALRWVTATGEFRYSTKGEPVQMLGIATDITDRKLAEEARDQSEEKFSKAFHHSPVAMTLIDTTEDRYLDVNGAFERDSGWQRDEVIGRNPYDLNIWVDPVRKSLVKKAVSENRVSDFEVRFRRKDGSLGVGLLSSQFIQIADKPCILSAIVDITDRKRVAEVLQQKESELAEAQRLAHVGSWQFDPKNRNITWSDELFRIHGLDPRLPPPQYKDFARFFTPESWERLRMVIQHATATGAVAGADLEVVRPDGSTRWVSTRGQVLHDSEGNVISIHGTSQDITDRKHAEDGLRRKERELAEAQRLAHVGSWEWDIKTGIIHWSEELYRIYGLDSTKPAPTLEELPKLYTSDTWKRLQEAIDGQSFPDLDMELIRPDGTRRWVRTRFEVTRGSDGVITTLRGTSQDITEEKQTRDQLQESEARLNAIVDSALDAIITVDAEQRIVLFNVAAETMFQCSASEALGYPLDRFIPAAHRSNPQKLVGTFAKNGETRRDAGRPDTLHAVRLNGAAFPIEASISRAESGGKELLTVIVRDITERKQSEQVLRESEERFRLVANTAPVMIWMCDLNDQRTYFNNPWLDFTGRKLQDELGEGWYSGIHPDDLEHVDTSRAAFRRRMTFEVQYRLRRHDGEYRWILDFGVPRFDPDGTFTGYIGSCIDITERKQAEEAMATIGRRLIEAHEEERTWIGRELHDDINQRLALLSVEMDRWLKDHSSRGPIRDLIHHAQQRISELSKDVQRLSHRLHSSKLEYLGLAKAANSFCREFSDQSRVEIAFTHHGVPRSLPKEISLCVFRVLQEALQNAVKYSGVTNFTVDLRGSTDSVELIVSDAGSGFDPAEALNRQGLGLISMRERLQMVHGEFSVRSAPGSGTIISARVPLENLGPQAMAG